MQLIKILRISIFVMALIGVMVLALLPLEMLTAPVFSWWDKAQHAVAFVVLTGLGFSAFPARWIRVALGLVLYGVLIEVAQLAVGWRFAEWQDVVADSLGVLFALMLRTGLQRRAAVWRDPGVRPSGDQVFIMTDSGRN